MAIVQVDISHGVAPPVLLARTAALTDEDFTAANRRRLRRRVREGGVATLPDEELLECILQRAIPRRNVRPLVHRLLKTFGDLGHVLAAAEINLIEVPGMTRPAVDQLKVTEVTCHRVARAKVMNQLVLDHWTALITYLHTALSHSDTERFRVLYLNKKNALIADEELGRGTVDHVPVYPREIVRRALAVQASALIVAHNHPSGDACPSDADIAMTHAIVAAAEALGIVLHDHVIIGKGEDFSFRSEGLL